MREWDSGSEFELSGFGIETTDFRTQKWDLRSEFGEIRDRDSGFKANHFGIGISGHTYLYRKVNIKIQAPVGINGNTNLNWRTVSLPMDAEYLEDLKWEMTAPDFIDGPAFFKFEFEISDDIQDTFLDLSSWGKAWLENYLNE